MRRPTRSNLTDSLFPYTTLVRSLVTSGCPETGMKREVRCNSGAAPATVTGEADANMPLVLWHREGRIHPRPGRSEEHTSELQSLMRISYAVFCFKKKQTLQKQSHHHYYTKNYRKSTTEPQ